MEAGMFAKSVIVKQTEKLVYINIYILFMMD